MCGGGRRKGRQLVEEKLMAEVQTVSNPNHNEPIFSNILRRVRNRHNSVKLAVYNFIPRTEIISCRLDLRWLHADAIKKFNSLKS